MADILADSSFLYALYSVHDRYHPGADHFAGESPVRLIVPDVILPEVTFLLKRAGGLPAVLGFLGAFVEAAPILEPLTPTDIRRARGIMAAYPEARLDFVDCCLGAVAERLGIRQICTFDRRNFNIIRPIHCEYFELLP